ncbi:MAG: hypothetical protein IKR73_00280 [Oscillospiraceae bacterium]|nr:hypothetical protein [Oscillospiraceae bacterium]
MNKKLSIVLAALLLSACTQAAGDPSAGAPAADGDTGTASLTDESASVGWNCGQVAIGGGGFVTGIISTNEPDLFYARTDVGGAYRWDTKAQSWKSLSLDISADDVGLLGVDGIAVDPNNAANVYMIAGTSYFSGGKTCVFVSHDYGDTFDRVDVSDMIRVHGNGMGRGNGERIAVDPNDPDVILIGGRTGGMIRSEDGGRSFSPVEFPVTSTKNENGINIVLFDGSKTKDGRTSRIYAGVSERSENNIYISEDGGTTWAPIGTVHEDMHRFMPQRFDLDSKGRLYVSCGNNEGPWNSMTGGLYRIDVDKDTAELLPADNVTIGDIVIDPKNDDHIVLVTSEVWKEQPNGAFGDIFYRSTDGGATWEQIADYTMSVNDGMTWIEDCAIHWCSCLAMDSSDPDRILVNSGNGIFACDDIWDEKPDFYFESKGIEETVPLDIVSFKDHPPVSAIGDYDGFVHEDIHASAPRHARRIGTTTSLAIAAQNNDIWVKVGGSDSQMLLTYTTDDGKSWTDITNSPDPDKTLYEGKVALTADGSSLIWSPSNSMLAYQTDDWGKTWNKVQGVAGNGNVYLIGDTADPDIVYGCANGVFYVSHDKGKTFKRKYDTSAKQKRLALEPGTAGRVYIPAGGMGLLTTDDAGENMALIPGLKYCAAVGTGRPKNDGDPCVIYVWGTPKDSDAEGLYMTEDRGETWERVNDDRHIFGGIGNGEFVAGDMNVYGRCYMSTVGLGIAYFDKNEQPSSAD